jgi:hypothetical protein
MSKTKKTTKTQGGGEENKEDSFFFTKASRCRSSWLARARKVGISKEEVPTRAEIQKVLEELCYSGLICYYSRLQFFNPKYLEIDHKQPISRGGSFKLDNICITTKRMNSAKGDMTEKEFLSLLEVISTFEDKGNSVISRLVSSNNKFRKKK